MAQLIPGTPVIWKDRNWILLDILGMDRVLVRDPQSRQTETVSPAELKTQFPEAIQSSAALAISDEEWRDALSRVEAIRPLLSLPPGKRSIEVVDAIARSLGKNRATIYRWLSKWEGSKTTTALVRSRRSDKGKSRLSEAVEAILKQEIDNYYLTRERPTPVELWERVAIECRRQQLQAPNLSTVRRRVDRLQDRLVVAKRYGSKQAREMFEPHRGTFPGADVPLSIYQIDHSPVDVILVDEKYRQPIGRGFLTTVIDSCTRMLAGFCVSLDPPGALSTGLAMSHAVLAKGKWLAERGIDSIWPIYGLPAKIYADNATEFRGTMLDRACGEYGIVMENRPKGLPNYGGYVERLFKTFMKRAQRIPGSTFSNTQERGDYDSEGRAIMTIADFERWFGIFVTKVYHQRPHRGIGRVPPVKLYEQFVLGSDDRKGIGFPAPIENEQKLRLDFTPYTERTIQEYGVVIDNIHYYADVLRPWVHARSPRNTKLKRKFIFARDPRDISEVYFLDPDTKTYHTVPYRDLTHPRMSIWDLRAILKQIADRPELQPDEATIFDGLEEMERVQKGAAERSKKARRTVQRRENWRTSAISAPQEAATALMEPAWDASDIKPFEDIEEAQ